MSKFTAFRDHFETFLATAFHKGIAALEPLADAIGHAVTPAVEAALLNAGKACAEAALAGTAHNSDQMFGVAVQSLRAEVPHLKVSVSTALAAAAIQRAEHAAAQVADALPSPQNAGL